MNGRLAWPIPLLSTLSIETSPQLAGSTPAWIAALFTGAFVVLWFLNAIGKLPKANGVTDKRIERIYDILTKEDYHHPGWPLVWVPIERIKRIELLLEELVSLKRMWQDDRDQWRAEREHLLKRIDALERKIFN